MSRQGSFLESEVLFQKLGTTWYVFTEIGKEVVYSALPEGVDPYHTDLELFDVIEEHMSQVASRLETKPPENAA